MGQFVPDRRRRPRTAIAISKLSGQLGVAKYRFESFGVVGFHQDGVPRYLEESSTRPVDQNFTFATQYRAKRFEF